MGDLAVPVEATAVDWRQLITITAWTWRAGGQTSTAMADTSAAAPALVEAALRTATQSTGGRRRGLRGAPAPTRVASMTAGRQSGTRPTGIHMTTTSKKCFRR